MRQVPNLGEVSVRAPPAAIVRALGGVRNTYSGMMPPSTL